MNTNIIRKLKPYANELDLNIQFFNKTVIYSVVSKDGIYLSVLLKGRALDHDSNKFLIERGFHEHKCYRRDRATFSELKLEMLKVIDARKVLYFSEVFLILPSDIVLKYSLVD